MTTRPHAFTRLELLGTIAALALMIITASPLWGGFKPNSQRIGCFNNLRQIGRAVQVWGADHNDRAPWITSVTEGGTRPDSSLKAGTAWVELITLSNELAGPRVFTCPSDAATKVASHWGNTANGFANSGFRGNALSYFVSYHGQPQLPRSVISGDRDFRPSTPPPVSCSRGNVSNAAGCAVFAPPLAWTNAVHMEAGHLLFVDGSVEYVNGAKLNIVLAGPETQNDAGSVHFINAR
jgi:hypothetical protein